MTGARPALRSDERAGCRPKLYHAAWRCVGVCRAAAGAWQRREPRGRATGRGREHTGRRRTRRHAGVDRQYRVGHSTVRGHGRCDILEMKLSNSLDRVWSTRHAMRRARVRAGGRGLHGNLATPTMLTSGGLSSVAPSQSRACSKLSAPEGSARPLASRPLGTPPHWSESSSEMTRLRFFPEGFHVGTK